MHLLSVAHGKGKGPHEILRQLVTVYSAYLLYEYRYAFFSPPASRSIRLKVAPFFLFLVVLVLVTNFVLGWHMNMAHFKYLFIRTYVQLLI